MGQCFDVGAKAVFLRVKAKTGAPEDAVIGVRGTELAVSVRARPEKGKANAEIIKLLSRTLSLSRDDVVLKNGASSPRKLFALPLSAEPALERLDRRMSP